MQPSASSAAQIVSSLQHILDQRSVRDSQVWSCERMHPVTMTRGVRMFGIRFCVHTWYDQWRQPAPHITRDLKVSVAMQLFRSEYLEDKFSAIIFLSEILIPERVIDTTHMPQFADLIDTACISGYEVCDKFSTLVLKQLLIDRRHEMMPLIAEWMRCECAWRARSAIWALIPLARDAIYENLILEGCSIVLDKTDDCCKLAVASALRALARTSPGSVYDFLHENHNLCRMSASGLSRACGDQHEWKAYFRQRRKDLQKSRRGAQRRSPMVRRSESSASAAAVSAASSSEVGRSAVALPPGASVVGAPPPDLRTAGASERGWHGTGASTDGMASARTSTAGMYNAATAAGGQAMSGIGAVDPIARRLPAAGVSTTCVTFDAPQMAVSHSPSAARNEIATESDIPASAMTMTHVRAPERRVLPSFSELLRGQPPQRRAHSAEGFEHESGGEGVTGARRYEEDVDSGDVGARLRGGTEDRTRSRR